MAEKKTRQANFELLRILAMLMVVSMHFLSHTGALPAAEAGRLPGEREIFGVLVESFCIVAVNAYVLLSGYFLSEKSFSFRRLLKLLLQILFYTLLIPAALAAAGQLPVGEAFNIYHIWNCLFPVQSGHYWFVTAYVVLVLFTPVLNGAVRVLNRKQLKAAILILLVFFSLGKSLSPFLFASDHYGYDYGWFLCLYLTGAYLHRYGSAFFGRGRRCVLIYLASCLLVAALVLASLFVCGRTGMLEYYASVPFHYNFIFAYTGALALFGAFARLRIPAGGCRKLICRVSPAMLGVYLIHEHVDVSSRWTGWLVGTPSEHLGGYVIQMAESVLILFAAAVCIDLLRGWLFAQAARLIGRTGAGRRIAGALEKADRMMEL